MKQRRERKPGEERERNIAEAVESNGMCMGGQIRQGSNSVIGMAGEPIGVLPAMLAGQWHPLGEEVELLAIGVKISHKVAFSAP